MLLHKCVYVRVCIYDIYILMYDYYRIGLECKQYIHLNHK